MPSRYVARYRLAALISVALLTARAASAQAPPLVIGVLPGIGLREGGATLLAALASASLSPRHLELRATGGVEWIPAAECPSLAPTCDRGTSASFDAVVGLRPGRQSVGGLVVGVGPGWLTSRSVPYVVAMIGWQRVGAGVRFRTELRSRALFKDGTSIDGWLLLGGTIPL